jgi:RNA-directed DNA polymerase
MELDRRGAVVQPELLAQPDEGRRQVAPAKSYEIDRREVWQAYKHVKANKGGAGVDGVTMAEFEQDLKGNLYKLWNRLSSGSYLPPAVKRVEIPKSDGKIRALGIPTIADRIAQQVVRQRLEPLLEPLFHDSSYGYRPERSAHDALRQARTQCWRRDWVLDLDIKGFFDNIDWGRLMKAVRKHAQCNWIELYIQRWLQADVIMPDGSVHKREKGTPQGGVISPLLANLFLHYAFDEWMKRQHGKVPFERYADDIICHCQSQAQAEALMEQVRARLAECELELNLQKSKVVYCADAKRSGNYESRKFDFLGYTFKPRAATDKRGVVFTNFAPAVADKAAVAMRREMQSWGLGRHNRWSLEEVLARVRPVVTGWVRYYGLFYRSELYRTLQTLDRHLVLWAQRKYKGLARHTERAWNWLDGLKSRMPRMFPHWFESIMTTGR